MWHLCVQHCSGDVAKYHPSTVWYAHVSIFSAFLFTFTDMPVGTSEKQFYSKGPIRCAYDGTFGVALDLRNRLIFISSCGRILSRNDDGKFCAVPARTLRKCDLKFLISTSAAFLRCLLCGNSSIFIFNSFCIICFRAFDTPLSNMWFPPCRGCDSICFLIWSCGGRHWFPLPVFVALPTPCLQELQPREGRCVCGHHNP